MGMGLGDEDVRGRSKMRELWRSWELGILIRIDGFFMRYS